MNDSNLKEFIEAVNSEVDNKIEPIREQADRESTELLENAENEALNDAYEKIKACVSEEKYKNKMTVSKAEQEARIKVLTYREGLVSRIFDSVSEKLNSFTQSDEYVSFLDGLLKGETFSADTVVFLRKEDIRYEADLRKITGNECAFEQDDTIVFGGLSVYDRNSSVLVNKTIDNMLDEQKKDFGSNYRLA